MDLQFKPSSEFSIALQPLLPPGFACSRSLRFHVFTVFFLCRNAQFIRVTLQITCHVNRALSYDVCKQTPNNFSAARIKRALPPRYINVTFLWKVTHINLNHHPSPHQSTSPLLPPRFAFGFSLRHHVFTVFFLCQSALFIGVTLQRYVQCQPSAKLRRMHTDC